MWNSMDTKSHYIQADSPTKNLTSSEKNDVAMLLLNPKVIIFRPLHIRKDLMKIFVSGKYQENQALKYFREKFLRLSEAKLKKVIFVGQQIYQLVKDTAIDLLFEGRKRSLRSSNLKNE